MIADGLGLVIGGIAPLPPGGHLSSHASPAGPGHADQADHCVSLYPSSGVQRHTNTGVVTTVAPDTGSLALERRGLLPYTSLAVAWPGYFRPDPRHDLVRLILGDLDELVLQVATLSGD